MTYSRLADLVVVVHLVFVCFVLFGLIAILLIPRLGLIGYGCAEIGAMASYFVLHRFATRLFQFTYRNAIPWSLAFVPIFFFPIMGWPWCLALLLPLGVISTSPAARGRLGEVWMHLRRGTV